MKESKKIRYNNINYRIKSARVFASHYQLMITDSMSRIITDEINWNDDKVKRGYAGDRNIILVGTEADLNDHWVDLYQADTAPALENYQRVISLPFNCLTGKIYISSVIDVETDPAIEAEIGTGEYTIYICGNNIGIDQLSLNEESELTDDEIRERHDLERYDVFVVAGLPINEGKIKDDT